MIRSTGRLCRLDLMSAALGGMVAHLAFWVLLAYGRAADQVSIGGVVAFVLIWVVAAVGLRSLPYAPAADMFPSVVAVLDVVLVLVIFKGDIRIS
jgi:hypothetical protein